MSGTAALPPAGVISSVGARFGVKGAGAAAWLAQQGIASPAAPNRISRWEGGRCLRLGNTEFLIELDTPGSEVPAADTAAQDAATAWILLRSDHSLLLAGPLWPGELARICSFDFDRWREAPDMVVMTLLAGIPVTLAQEPDSGAPAALRLWCDASHASYLDHCLQQLAATSTSGETR